VSNYDKIDIMPPLKLGRLTRVARIRRVDVYVHWSVFLIAALILMGAVRLPLVTATGLTAYLSLLILHESGHLIVARLKGYEAFSIELYPIFGLARSEKPDSRFDLALVAWGGVLAQAVIGVPLALGVSLFGYTRCEALNAVLVILGGYSLCSAAFNLLPVRPLDGSVAWDLIPAYFEQKRIRKNRNAAPYRSAR
jgi:stage IV sporulation protein FB